MKKKITTIILMIALVSVAGFSYEKSRLSFFGGVGYKFFFSDEFTGNGIERITGFIRTYSKFYSGYDFEAGTGIKIENNIRIYLSGAFFTFTEKVEKKFQEYSVGSYFNKDNYYGISISPEVGIGENGLLFFKTGFFKNSNSEDTSSTVETGIGLLKEFVNEFYFKTRLSGGVFTIKSKTYPIVKLSFALERNLFN